MQKTIERFPNYEITTDGKVYSKTKKIFLKPFSDQNGYLLVHLRNDKEDKVLRIHRLVAETFLANPDKLPCVNHKDENKQNNNFENLEWCSIAYNNNYGTRQKRASDSNRHKILQLSNEGELIKEWDSVSKVAEYFHVSESKVYKVIAGIKYCNIADSKWQFKAKEK